MAECSELTAFAVATESLDQRALTDPRLGRKNYWRNLIGKGTFVKNQGVTRSTFGIKTSEPTDDQSLWTNITLSNGLLPACDPSYEAIDVAYLERTYGPKERRFKGPVICKKNLTFQHNVEMFLEKYVLQLGGYIGRVWEFSLRQDYLSFVPIYVDGAVVQGPNALATSPRAFQGLTYDSLQDMAAGMLDQGAGAVEDEYTNWLDSGPVFPLEIDMRDSGAILKANSTIREDAQYASMGKGTDSNQSLWKGIGANRVLGNFRHVVTNVPLRLNYVEGTGYVVVTPFKDVNAVGSDSVILTDEYINAAFGVAIATLPQVFTAEVVLPTNWKFPDASNYNGELEFITGGERICETAEYDPQHEKGRHFGIIEYAARPDYPNTGAALIYKRCQNNTDTIYCS